MYVILCAFMLDTHTHTHTFVCRLLCCSTTLLIVYKYERVVGVGWVELGWGGIDGLFKS